jgi:hypothetical protein
LEVIKWLVENGNATVDLQLEYGKYGSALSAAAASYRNLVKGFRTGVVIAAKAAA